MIGGTIGRVTSTSLCDFHLIALRQKSHMKVKPRCVVFHVCTYLSVAIKKYTHTLLSLFLEEKQHILAQSVYLRMCLCF